MEQTNAGPPEERDTVRLEFLGEWEAGEGRPVAQHAREHPQHAADLLDCAVAGLELSNAPTEPNQSPTEAKALSAGAASVNGAEEA